PPPPTSAPDETPCRAQERIHGAGPAPPLPSAAPRTPRPACHHRLPLGDDDSSRCDRAGDLHDLPEHLQRPAPVAGPVDGVPLRTRPLRFLTTTGTDLLGPRSRHSHVDSYS